MSMLVPLFNRISHWDSSSSAASPRLVHMDYKWATDSRFGVTFGIGGPRDDESGPWSAGSDAGRGHFCVVQGVQGSKLGGVHGASEIDQQKKNGSFPWMPTVDGERTVWCRAKFVDHDQEKIWNHSSRGEHETVPDGYRLTCHQEKCPPPGTGMRSIVIDSVVSSRRTRIYSSP